MKGIPYGNDFRIGEKAHYTKIEQEVEVYSIGVFQDMYVVKDANGDLYQASPQHLEKLPLIPRKPLTISRIAL